jgi:hypothetical protein
MMDSARRRAWGGGGGSWAELPGALRRAGWGAASPACNPHAWWPSRLQAIERQLTGESGSKLDTYEMEVAGERADTLQVRGRQAACVDAMGKDGREGQRSSHPPAHASGMG